MAHIHKQFDITLLLSVQAHRKRNFKMAYLFATIANLVAKTTSIACFMSLSWNLPQTNTFLAE